MPHEKSSALTKGQPSPPKGSSNSQKAHKRWCHRPETRHRTTKSTVVKHEKSPLYFQKPTPILQIMKHHAKVNLNKRTSYLNSTWSSTKENTLKRISVVIIIASLIRIGVVNGPLEGDVI